MIGLEFDCPKCGNMNEHNVRLENYGEYIDQDKENPFCVAVDCESCYATLRIILQLKVKPAPAGDTSYSWLRRRKK